jgi:hypothetical protein
MADPAWYQIEGRLHLAAGFSHQQILCARRVRAVAQWRALNLWLAIGCKKCVLSAFIYVHT